MINQVQRWKRSIVAAAVLVSGINSVAAGEKAFLLACAERDLRVVAMLEDRGSTNDVPADKLAGVFFTVMAARRACADGRIAEGIVLYDGLTLGMVLAGMPQ